MPEAGSNCTAAADAKASSRPGPADDHAGGDFFVPWHVPFHRVDAALVAATLRAGGGAGSSAGACTGTGLDGQTDPRICSASSRNPEPSGGGKNVSSRGLEASSRLEGPSSGAGRAATSCDARDPAGPGDTSRCAHPETTQGHATALPGNQQHNKAGAPAAVLSAMHSPSAHAPGVLPASPPAAAAWTVDREKSAVVVQRYCHLYGPGELEALMRRVPGASVASSCYDRSNWCVVMQAGQPAP